MDQQQRPAASFPSGGGDLAEMIRRHDWRGTPLGPLETWPAALRTTVQIMLDSRFAMWLAWGPELRFFCNDAYRPTLGAKQGWLGTPAAEVWREIWPAIGPRIESVMRGGPATWDEELLLFLERHGFPEETYHTFSYSPVPGDDGQVGGMLCVVTEETTRVIGARRMAMLRDLGGRFAATRTRAEVLEAFGACLAADDRDIPFSLLYLLEGSGRGAVLAQSSGLPEGALADAERLDGEAADQPWPLARILDGEGALPIDRLPAPLAGLPLGSWQVPPGGALALPLVLQGGERPVGMLVAGLNPGRPLDDDYRGFLGLLTGQLSAALASARAYEEQRARAEALVELDRAKTTFFSNVSHEFRTPLTLLLSPLEQILARPEETLLPVPREQLRLMHRNGQRLLKLVNSLLDFSRIEAGRWQARYEPLDLAAFTADLASAFRSALERAGLELQVDCPPLPAPVYVDRDMWEKIVLNLVSNAFKYTLRGSVRVALAPTDDGEGVALTVSDSGVGIPPEQLPRLFERFHRIEGQRGRTFEGSGIGLALVLELVKLHGGAIHVASRVDAGTTMTVVLPFGPQHLPAESIVAPREAGPGATAAFVEEALRWLPGEPALSAGEGLDAVPAGSPATRRGRIVLADDNADMREYLLRLLSRDYAVEAVGDGRAALAAARRAPPDLVLSDVMMPGLDGFGLLAALREDAVLRDVPVLLLSARAGEEAKVEGLAAGAADYLAKPFSARELLARVAAAIEVARLRRETTETLREEARRLAILNRTGAALAAELELERLVQTVTDAGVELTGARFGAFFYNVVGREGKSYTLYTLSGAQRSDFERFPMPRNTEIFAPTFHGVGVVRSDDILEDPRYGRNPPYHGMPRGHLPVRSYLAVPVKGRSGEVIGGLFFGHPEPGIFDQRAELIVVGIAAQAAIAMDNARLFRTAREAAAELGRLNESLEARVEAEIAERLKAEEAFRQAQKMESVGRLTGGIAHDFNNLLTIVLGNIETLQRRALRGEISLADGSFTRLTDAALAGAKRAATLTQRLLAFSRRQSLDPKPLDANRLVTGMSDLLRRSLGESIVTEVVLAGGLWTVSADANQLESALLNLAVNARDAMPGGGKLTIETANAFLDEAYAARHTEVQSGQYVLIAVSDSGSGMPPEVVARAFEPFFTTKDVGAGTGLGLSQVYGFVKQSGGHVKIYSEIGEGTVVKLYLPRLNGGESALDPAPAQRREVGGTREEVILVVEDDDGVRAHSTSMLRELGYGVIDAPDGAAALQMLALHPEVRLLFTDVGLPGGMNGRQLADAAQRRHPGLKVLYTTGYARNAIVHHGRLDQGLALLPKPFTFADLAAKVRHVLEN